MRVIIKIEVREITFGHAVIAWNFFLIFLLLQYCEFLASSEKKNQKESKKDEKLKKWIPYQEEYGPKINKRINTRIQTPRVV